MMNGNKRSCLSTVVAYQGQNGAFSEMAALAVFDNNPQFQQVQTLGLATFELVFEAVREEKVQFGIVPVENSNSGTIQSVYDQLISAKNDLRIVAEHVAVEEHCLCVSSDDLQIQQLRQVVSHPAILQQCESFLANLEKTHDIRIKRISEWDSAGSCSTLKQQQMTATAAIASEKAAEFHGLHILEKGIGNELHSETRYIIISRMMDHPPLPLQRTYPLKSSLALSTPNEPQALLKIVAAFSLRNMSITKIESRPASTATALGSSKHWDYIFYIDYEPSQNDETNEHLLANLKEHSLWVRELGTYSQNVNRSKSTTTQLPKWSAICDTTAF